MPYRPPLTRAQLHEIQERNPDSPDVRALLWEIKRLRGIVLRADQVQRSLGDIGGAVGVMVHGLRHELQGEPCIDEFPRVDE